MRDVFEFLADQPLVVLFLVVLVGTLVGRVTVAGVSLGAAAVLFTAIALTAWGTTYDVTLTLPDEIGNLGLVLFAFAVGMLSGPAFFHALRAAWPMVLTVVAVLSLGAATAFGLGRLSGVSSETIAGTFAGALNCTPALAAAGGSADATVGYASAYVYGVLGMLALTIWALVVRRGDTDAPTPVRGVTVRIDTDEPLSVASLRAQHGGQIAFSRVRHEETGPPLPVGPDDVLHRGDVVTVVGAEDEIDALVQEIGHVSSHDLSMDRRHLDFRRITVSDHRLAGRPISALELERQFQAIPERVRRGDVDLVSTPDMVVQLGDRIRVVAPSEQMPAVSRYLGDSTRGLTDVNPVALGLGLVAGILLGLLPVPLPGGGSFTIGVAAGTLVAGLVMGRVGRVGGVVTTLPHTALTVISDIGLLVFLSYAGTKAGSLILDAVASGEVFTLVVVGAGITTVVGLATFAAMRLAFRVGGTRLSGTIAGTQTQPALLAYANSRTGNDPRVALGWSLVYPAGMITKILLAQLLAGL
jgi:putative transport protein